MKEINTFETSQCIVVVFNTETKWDNIEIWGVKSFHKKSKKINVRFGTKKQIDGIVKTYHQEKRFEL